MTHHFFRLPLTPPFLWYDELENPTPYRSVFHSHPAWQLTISLSGNLFFEYQGKRSCLAPGEWILFSPELLHCAGSESPVSTAAQIFFRRFPGEMLPEFSRSLNFRRNFVATGKFPGKKLVEHIKSFRKLENHTAVLYHTQKNLLPLNFLVDALETLPLDSVSNKELPGKLLATLEYMEQHYAEPLGVPDFAAQAGLSVSRFNELFRRSTGLSPMRYFNEIRLCHAETALRAGESVENAARQAGFSSSGYFCRCFKNYTGRTPGEFRNDR